MNNLEKSPPLQLAKLKEIFECVSGTRKTFLGLCYGWRPISRKQVNSLNEKINIALLPGNEDVKKIIDTGMISCLEAWRAQLELRLNMSEDGKISFASDSKSNICAYSKIIYLIKSIRLIIFCTFDTLTHS